MGSSLQKQIFIINPHTPRYTTPTCAPFHHIFNSLWRTCYVMLCWFSIIHFSGSSSDTTCQCDWDWKQDAFHRFQLISLSTDFESMRCHRFWFLFFFRWSPDGEGGRGGGNALRLKLTIIDDRRSLAMLYCASHACRYRWVVFADCRCHSRYCWQSPHTKRFDLEIYKGNRYLR